VAVHHDCRVPVEDGRVFQPALPLRHKGNKYLAVRGRKAKRRKLTRTTLPHLLTVFALIFLMNLNLGNAFHDPGQFWTLPMEGGMGIVPTAIEVVGTFAFRLVRQASNLGLSAAAGLFQNLVQGSLGLICIVAIMVVKKLIRKNNRKAV